LETKCEIRSFNTTETKLTGGWEKLQIEDHDDLQTHADLYENTC
jgi:hypothetical protein